MPDGMQIGSGFVEIVAQDNTAAGRAKVAKAVQSIRNGTVKIDADIAVAQAEIGKVEANLNDLRNRRTDPKIDADIAAAMAKMDQVSAKLGALRLQEASPKVDADIRAAEANIRQIQVGIDALDAKRADPKIDADIAAGQAKIRKLQAQISGLRDRRVRIDVDTDKASSGLRGIETNALNAQLSLLHLSIAGGGLSKIAGGAGKAAVGLMAIVTAGGAAGAALAALPVLGAAVGGMAGVIAGSFSGVGGALDAYTKAQDEATTAADGGAAAAKAYEQALAKLNPQQRELVKQLTSMKPLLEELKKTASAAFLPGLTQMLKDSEGLFPIFQENIRATGTIMGDAARKMGELFKSDQFKADLDALLKSSLPVTKAIGDMFVGLTGSVVAFGAKMGPAADAFAGFLDDVTAGFDGFFKALSTDESVAAFASIWDSLGQIMRDLLPIIGQLVSAFAERLAPILADVAQWITANKDSIAGWIQKLVDWAPAILGFALAIKGLSVALSIKKWFDGVTGLFDSVGGAADRNGTKLDGFKGKLGGLAKSLGKGALAGGALLGGGALAGALAPGSSDDPDTGNTVDDTANNLGGAAGQIASGDFASIFDDIGAEIDQLTTKWQAGQLPIQHYWQAFTTWIGRLPADVGGWFTGIYTNATTWLEQTRLAIGAKVSGVWTDFTTWLGGLPAQVGGWFASIWTNATTWLQTTKDDLLAKASGIATDFTTWLGSLPDKITTWFADIKTRAGDWFQQTKDDLLAKAGGIVDGITTWLSQLPGRAADWFGQMKDRAVGKAQELIGEAGTWPGRIAGALGNLGGLLVGAGSDVVNGLWRGISSGWSWLTSNVRALAGRLLSAAKGALGIASPSKLFRDEVGKWIPEGLGAGIIANARAATDAARAMASDVTDAGTPGLLTSGAMALPVGSLPGGMSSVSGGDGAATTMGATTINLGGVTLQVQGILDFRDGSTATRKMLEDLRAGLIQIERSYSRS